MTKSKEIPREWCFVTAIIGGTICFIISLVNLSLISLKTSLEWVPFINSFTLLLASICAIYISYLKIVGEKYFMKSLIIGVFCFLIATASTYLSVYELHLKGALIMNSIIILIAAVGGIFISYIKMKEYKESYFIAPLSGGAICLILAVATIFLALFIKTDIINLFILPSLSIMIASIPIVYVPSHKFRLGIIELPWR